MSFADFIFGKAYQIPALLYNRTFYSFIIFTEPSYSIPTFLPQMAIPSLLRPVKISVSIT